jgi:replication factor C small subunit
MSISKNDLFVEKYRPQNFDDLVLDPKTRGMLDKFIKENSIPHLLLIGRVGCGKTTIAKILVNTLDCDYLLLNASDERGIDVIREKVKRFAMTSSFKKWKIVFMDEFDACTPDAQYSLRNIMETYSEQTRFILTANYANKIIDPIRSRCQVIEFLNLGRKDILILLDKILQKEDIEYQKDDLLTLVDTYYPDIRSMINHIQLNTVDGKWSLVSLDSFRNLEQLLEFIKKKKLAEIRSLDLDYQDAMKYLFDKVDDLTDDYSTVVELSLLIADHLYKSTFAPEKSINFASCCLGIMEKLKR